MLFAAEEEDFYVAQKAFNDEFYDASKKLFEKFIENYPDSQSAQEAKLYIAKSLFYSEEFPEAEKVLAGLINNPLDTEIKAESIYWLGKVNYQAKKVEKAAGYYKKVKNEYPESTVFWWACYSLGLAYLESGQPKKAEDILKEVVSADADKELLENAYYALAEYYYEAKEYHLLQELLVAWIEEFPNSSWRADIYFYLAETEYFFKDYEASIGYYRKAIQFAKDESLKDSVYRGLGWIYLDKKDYEKAEEWFLQVRSGAVRMYSLASLYFNKEEYKEAGDYFTDLIDNYPDNAYMYQAYLGKAESLYELGRINDAIFYYRKLIEDKVKEPQLLEESLRGLGWCYLKMEDYKTAIDYFKKVTAFSEEPVVRLSAQINIADVYQDSGKVNEALDIYEGALKKFPNNLYSDYIQLQIGLCLLKLNDFEASLLAFRNLEDNFPESKFLQEATYYKALSHVYLQNLQEAENILKAFIEEYSQSKYLKEAYLLLIQVYSEREDKPEVLRVFDNIYKRFSDNEDFIAKVQIRKGVFFIDLQEYRQAADTFERFLKLFPDSRLKNKALFYLATVYHTQADYTKAKEFYSRILNNLPVDRYTYHARLNLAEILWQEEKFAEAKAVLNKNRTVSVSKDIDIQTNLTYIEFLLDEHNFKSAVELCDKLIKKYPESRALFYFKKARIYEDKGDYARAYENYVLAEEEGYGAVELYFYKGYVLEKTGNSEDAIKSYFDVIYMYPDEEKFIVKAYLHIAKLYEKKEDFKEAKKYYSKVVDMGVEEAKYAKQKIEELNESLAQAGSKKNKPNNR